MPVLSTLLLSFVLAFFSITGLLAQHVHHGQTDHDVESDPAVIDFLQRARVATEVYHNLEAAIAAGYRLMGPDMPNMGEHWIHPRLAVHSSFDPSRPSVLTYVRVSGKPVLTGVAYTQTVGPGEKPPNFPFDGAWHYHAGSLDEEAFGLTPHGMMHEDGGEPRLAMLHIWIWKSNPDGLFTADNWGLSFVRLSLPVPSKVSPDASRALFLVSGGVDYFSRMVQVAGDPTPKEREAVRKKLMAYQAKVRKYLAQKDEASHNPDVVELAGFWQALWVEIAEEVSPELWSQLHTFVE